MLHPLGYHPLVERIGYRGFWMPILDDRARGTALTRLAPSPPAYLAAVGADLVLWRPERAPVPVDHAERVESWSLA
ncbi:MAG TPA: hypothetical protein VF156_15640 [Agromyces sp.]